MYTRGWWNSLSQIISIDIVRVSIRQLLTHYRVEVANNSFRSNECLSALIIVPVKSFVHGYTRLDR